MAERPSASETMRGRVAPVDDDDGDERVQPRQQTGSAAIRQAVEAGVHAALKAGATAAKGSHPRLAHAMRMIAMTLAVGGIGVGGFMVGDELDASETECDPLVMRHALHLARTGHELAEVMRKEGQQERAAAVERMVDPNLLPDDLRLCLLLEQRQAANGAP